MNLTSRQKEICSKGKKKTVILPQKTNAMQKVQLSYSSDAVQEPLRGGLSLEDKV